MAYSRSLTTLQNRLPFLEKLQEGEECVWECHPTQEKSQAQKIREALFIAKEVAPEKYPALAAAKDNFEIRETGNGRVEARRKVPSLPRPLAATAKERESPQENLNINDLPKNLLLDSGRVLAHKNLTLLGILSVLRDSAGFDSAYFKDPIITNDELLSFHGWLQKNHPSVLLFWDGSSITLKPFSPELEPLAFEPDDLNTEKQNDLSDPQT